jgi:hypothetical protein
MLESTQKVPNNNSISGNNNNNRQDSKITAYRLSAKVYPLYNEIAKHLHQIGYSQRPDITALAKFSLNYMAELWVGARASQTSQNAKGTGSERSPVGKSIASGFGQDNSKKEQTTTRHA